MATVRPGHYLLDFPPARSQGRLPRRSPVRSIIVVHTAESGTDLDGPDPKAERVAAFIQGRNDPGSYHLVGDADSIVPLLPFDWETWSDRTGSNRWAIHISLAMNAADWPTLPAARRDQLVDTAGQMAAMAARWLEARGRPLPASTLLTKAQSDQPTASGFISHALRDPGRRSDPGDGFPWADFFAAYQRHLTDTTTPGGSTVPPTDEVRRLTLELQDRILADPRGRLPRFGRDGDPGAETLGALVALWDARTADLEQVRRDLDQTVVHLNGVIDERDTARNQAEELAVTVAKLRQDLDRVLADDSKGAQLVAALRQVLDLDD